jgi:hypothetical protein
MIGVVQLTEIVELGLKITVIYDKGGDLKEFNKYQKRILYGITLFF